MILRCCFPSSFRPCTLRIIAATRPGSQSLEFTASVKPGKIWEYLSSSKVKRWHFRRFWVRGFLFFHGWLESFEATWFVRIGRHNCVVQILVVAQSISWQPLRHCPNLGKMWKFETNSLELAPQRGILERWMASIFVDHRFIPTWGRFRDSKFLSFIKASHLWTQWRSLWSVS